MPVMIFAILFQCPHFALVFIMIKDPFKAEPILCPGLGRIPTPTLAGSEGQGIADVLCGECDFKGRLPSPWYASVAQIETKEPWLEKGYGLTYEKDAE